VVYEGELAWSLNDWKQVSYRDALKTQWLRISYQQNIEQVLEQHIRKERI